MKRPGLSGEKYTFILQVENLEPQEQFRWIAKKIFQHKEREALKSIEELEVVLDGDNIYNR